MERDTGPDSDPRAIFFRASYGGRSCVNRASIICKRIGCFIVTKKPEPGCKALVQMLGEALEGRRDRTRMEMRLLIESDRVN